MCYLSVIWSAQIAGWNVNSIQEFPGQGTLGFWYFIVLDTTRFCVLANILNSMLQSRYYEREYICGQNLSNVEKHM